MQTNEQRTDDKQPARAAAAKDPAPGGGIPAGLLALQGTAGNAAVVQMLRASGHRLTPPEEHQHGAGCGHQEQPAVQRSAVHDVLRTGGSPLDDSTRTDMEGRLGADFSDVRIHNDAAAKASAAEVGARAYTSGSHVVIGDGGGDRHTLAHELTHVIQQRQGPVAGTDNGSGLKVSDPSDRFEREAESNAARALAGPAPVVQRATTPDFSDVEDVLHSDSDSDGGYESAQNLDAARLQKPGRQTTPVPQPAAGFGRSQFGLHPSRLPTLRHDAQGRPAPRIEYRADSEPLYRWDRRLPDEIFPQGFRSWNVKVPNSLRSYQKTLKESRRSALVSVTRSGDGYAPEWAIENGRAIRYTIRAPGGMDLVESLGTVAFHQQQEVAFWKGIRPEFIQCVDIYQVAPDGTRTLVEHSDNPGFGNPQQDGDAMDTSW
ncbi:DUF4157 domain-containing protein [Streptomyces sp. NPDC007172]|uniref:eCIS core domain-containing protein n=1 Tax=Streptomyces sp. NPDC007172 TaxID=3364776 RepID=UPI0036BCEE1E